MLDMTVINVLRHALAEDSEAALAKAGGYAAQGDRDMAEYYRGVSMAYLWASKNMGSVEAARDVLRVCREFVARWGNTRMGAWRRGYVETLGVVADGLAGLV